MASSPPVSPDRDQDIDMGDSPINDRRLSGRSSVRASMQPRTPNNVNRQVSRATRPPVMIATDDNEQDRESVDSSIVGPGTQHIWGTNIEVDRAKRKLRKFIETFTKEGLTIYPELIQDALEAETFCLPLDCSHLHSYDPELYKQVVRFPQEMLPAIDEVANAYASEHYSDLLAEVSGAESDIWTRPHNLISVRSMRDMNPLDIDCLVAIRGMVIRSTSIIPDIQDAFFRCQLCGSTEMVGIQFGRIEEPYICKNEQCQGRHTMELIHNRCVFQDKQLVKVQETPENIPDGETPQTIDMYCFDSLVDACKPGDRIEVTGVYRAAAIRRNPRRRVVDAVYKTYLDAVHINRVRNNQMSAEEEDSEAMMAGADGAGGEDIDMDAMNAPGRIGEIFEPRSRQAELEAKLAELGQEQGIYAKLVNSLAPSIWEMEDVKKGILCQLFGASRKDFSDTTGAGGRFRNQLNILLCGDPGTSKSQLLQYVHKVAPRGIYTSGKGSSAVGLTAYITKDPDSGDLVLESGALVLSDRGVCCIDEFDKMSEAARSVLHEVMEQQTVSIAKAGIICTLNARTSILAAANPIESRYNPTKSVVENIDLPPTLMSRFDLIYLVLDRPNQDLDRKLAKHLVSLYYADEEVQRRQEQQRSDRLEGDMLMKYIDYSKKNFNPVLSEDACDRLVESYVELRGMGRESGKKVITATPRQLESLIRISEALARMKHQQTVEVADVEEALRLHKVATLAAATDPRTGAIDLDSINVGRTAEQEQELERRATRMMDVLRGYKRRTIRANVLLQKFNKSVEEEQEQGGAARELRKIGVSELKKVVQRLEQAERLRLGEWMQDDPLITILSREAL